MKIKFFKSSVIMLGVLLIILTCGQSKADWQNSYTYLSGTTVTVSGNRYMCIQTHTSYPTVFDIRSFGGMQKSDIGPILTRPERIVIDGRYAYITSHIGNAVEVIDVINPLAPTYVSSLFHGESGAALHGAYGIFKQNNFLYITNFRGYGLEIIDVSDPTNLAHVGSVTGINFSGATDVRVEGNYAYVISVGTNTLQTVDVSDPTHPYVVSLVANGQNNAFISNPYRITKNGNRLYIANSGGTGGLEILDVSSGANPIHLGKIMSGSVAALKTAVAVVVSGDYAYVTAKGSNALEIIDVSSGANPIHLGKIVRGQSGAILNSPHGLYKRGNYVYVLSDAGNTLTGALDIIDVSSGANPILVGSLTHGSGGAQLSDVESMVVTGDYAFIVNIGGMALEVVNISTPATPTHVAKVYKKIPLVYSYDAQTEGNYLYVLGSTFGTGSPTAVVRSIAIFDTSDPSHLVYAGGFIDTTNILAATDKIIVSSGYIYVPARTPNTMQILDARDPAHIIVGGKATVNTTPYSIAKKGNYVYVTTRGTNHGVDVIDVSNPLNPIAISTGRLYNGQSGALLSGTQGMYILGNYLYVVNNAGAALEIIDVSIPTQPTHIGKITDGTSGALIRQANNVYVTGNYAYIISQTWSTLEVVDISDPANPKHMTGYTGTGEYVRITGLGNFVYVTAKNSNKVEVFDISSGANPIFYTSSAIDPSFAYSTYGKYAIAASGEYIYTSYLYALNIQTFRAFTGDNEPGIGSLRTNYRTLLDTTAPVFITGSMTPEMVGSGAQVMITQMIYDAFGTTGASVTIAGPEGFTKSIPLSLTSGNAVTGIWTATYIFSGDAIDGRYTISGSATDQSGNTGYIDIGQFTLDQSTPTTSLVSIASYVGKENTMTITISAQDTILGISGIIVRDITSNTLATVISGTFPTAATEIGAWTFVQEVTGDQGMHREEILIQDLAGNIRTVTGTFVYDSIDPTATIVYTPNITTAGNVTATLYGDEDISITNNGGSSGYVFTDNGSFMFEFQDLAGNTGRLIATVGWIQHTATNQGGGGGSFIVKDQCPVSRDCSDSYYDQLCGKCTLLQKAQEKITNIITGSPKNKLTGNITNSSFSTELNNAYVRAYSCGITTMPTIQKANIEGVLIRKDMAKMIVNFALNILKKDISTGATCEFADIKSLTKEAQYYAIAACRLGLMGWESDGLKAKNTFDPNQEVDRAQFGTILSRLLRQNTYNSNDINYFSNHLTALKKEGIMTKIDSPSSKELRGWVMLMMQRITDK